jgi:hypothetical protein
MLRGLRSQPQQSHQQRIEFESISVEPEYEEVPHGDNLAELIDESDLESMGSELVGDFMSDLRTRDDWAMAYVKGLDLLGMKVEDRTQPWEGASGVFHPMLTEAAIHFQAQAMGEIYPASGPARTKILGKMTTEKFQQATRVENELNYLITERMQDYREETEQMLFRLSLAGSAFKKVHYDPVRRVPKSTFVPAEDFVVQYGISNLSDCERYTHVMRKTKTEIMKLQASGFYRDVELPDPSLEKSDIQEKYDTLQGVEDTSNGDDRYMLLEMHVEMVMPEGFNNDDDIARPYVITIDKSSRTILSIRKNWYEDDNDKQKRMHFVPYCYLPGMGFYGSCVSSLTLAPLPTYLQVSRPAVSASRETTHRFVRASSVTSMCRADRSVTPSRSCRTRSHRASCTSFWQTSSKRAVASVLLRM